MWGSLINQPSIEAFVRLSELPRGSGEEQMRQCQRHSNCLPSSKGQNRLPWDNSGLSQASQALPKARLCWQTCQLNRTESPNRDSSNQDGTLIFRNNEIRRFNRAV